MPSGRGAGAVLQRESCVVQTDEDQEVEITPEMIEAGPSALLEWLPEAAQPPSFADRVAEEVFRAMKLARRP